jgi:hypothetical protein
MTKRILRFCLLVLCVLASRSYADVTGNYCSVNDKLEPENKTNYLVLIDPSHNHSDEDVKALGEGLLQIFKRLNDFDRLTVKVTDSSNSNGDRLFDRCMPACEDSSFFSCDKMRIRKDKLKFRNNLVKRSIDALSDSRLSKNYPDLIRTLNRVARKFPSHTEIVVFSEMVHRSQEHKPQTESDFDNLFFHMVTNDQVPYLANLTMTVFGFTGDSVRDSVDRYELTRFWEEVFKLSGAVSFSISEKFVL